MKMDKKLSNKLCTQNYYQSPSEEEEEEAEKKGIHDR
jgi:hypothetical protein